MMRTVRNAGGKSSIARSNVSRICLRAAECSGEANSWGTLVAVALALRYPRKVKALILASPRWPAHGSKALAHRLHAAVNFRIAGGPPWPTQDGDMTMPILKSSRVRLRLPRSSYEGHR
jgi:pimeloyl-ACP methyl ester carboxylesterase